MKVQEFAKTILYGPGLEDKLLSSSLITDFTSFKKTVIPDAPARSSDIAFCEKQIKFPKASHFEDEKKRALALHFFANHELLAIELMAAAILAFDTTDESSERLVRGLVQTIKDEQKHLQLYIHRMKQMGIQFGELPLNQFFWNLFVKVKGIEEFFALMALTLEAANLDFCCYYQKIFRDHGDLASADLLNIVYEDEITHVALGVNWLNRWRGDRTMWDYYVSLLPEKVTPARGKGKTFDHEGRLKSGLDSHFVESSRNYRDNFVVTQRKEWKS